MTGHGTGRFAGVTGTGSIRTSIISVTAKDATGKCIHLNDPATYQAIATATASITR